MCASPTAPCCLITAEVDVDGDFQERSHTGDNQSTEYGVRASHRISLLIGSTITEDGRCSKDTRLRALLAYGVHLTYSTTE